MAVYHALDHRTGMYINPARAWNGNPGALEQHRYWLDAEPYDYDDLAEALDAKFTVLAENSDNDASSVEVFDPAGAIKGIALAVLLGGILWAIIVYVVLKFT